MIAVQNLFVLQELLFLLSHQFLLLTDFCGLFINTALEIKLLPFKKNFFGKTLKLSPSSLSLSLLYFCKTMASSPRNLMEFEIERAEAILT